MRERKLTSGPVGKTVLKSVLGQLLGVSLGENEVSLQTRSRYQLSAPLDQAKAKRGTNLELGVNDLDDDVPVGEADDKTVLGGVVLVLGLRDQTLPGVV